MKPNDKAIEAARAEGKRWREGLNRPENQIPYWKVLREADDGYDGYDVIAKFNSPEERDKALERLRAEAMLTAAYAAQFQSDDYAGLIKDLRTPRGRCLDMRHDAADAIEALLAKLNNKPKPSEDYAGLVGILRAAHISNQIEWRAADAIEALLAERDDFAEQLALRSESGMAKDMQEIMRINNELKAERDKWESAYKEITDTYVKIEETTVDKLKKVEAERDALAARLAPVEDEELVDIAAETWIEATTGLARRPSAYTISERAGARAAIAAIRPHIEAEERERCAKIAEARLRSVIDLPDGFMNGWERCQRSIAAAIRSGK